MRFQLVTGPVFSITCLGCGEHKTAGSELYRSAATGRLDGQPDRVYADLDGASFDAYYCESCAVSHADSQDPTRSVSQFYIDTRGEETI
jgi:hypothetical protein